MERMFVLKEYLEDFCIIGSHFSRGVSIKMTTHIFNFELDLVGCAALSALQIDKFKLGDCITLEPERGQIV
jgi:hypothetical protein